jgi:hypothetical protein
MVDRPGIDSFHAVGLLSPESARVAAQLYLDRLGTVAPTVAARVIDEMPDNLDLIGLVAVLWPGSRVIVCNREVRDIAVSCWFAGFETNPWAPWPGGSPIIGGSWHTGDAPSPSNGWKSITRARLKTWRGMHALVDFTEFDWDPACLDFHPTRRAVRTASLVQVRDPIQSHSVGRWKNYESSLQPLLQALRHYGVALTQGG